MVAFSLIVTASLVIRSLLWWFVELFFNKNQDSLKEEGEKMKVGGE